MVEAYPSSRSAKHSAVCGKTTLTPKSKYTSSYKNGLAMKKQAPTTAAALLAMAASIIELAVALLALSAAKLSISYVQGWDFYAVYYLATGVLGTAAFPFVLTAVIFVLKRKAFKFSLASLSLLAVCGVVMCYPLWFFGAPILALSILSIILVALSKSQFNTCKTLPKSNT